MTFIHKNVNSALLMLITFISVALVTATVYSVQAFDSMQDAYAEKAMQADELAQQLAENKAQAESLQEAAQLTQAREKALAEIMQKQRDEAQLEQKPAVEAKSQSITNSNSGGPVFKAPYNPYRQKYWGWTPNKLYVI